MILLQKTSNASHVTVHMYIEEGEIQCLIVKQMTGLYIIIYTVTV